MRIKFLGCLLLIVGSSALAQSDVTTAKSQRFRAGVMELHRKYGVPAVSVTVYSDKGLVAAEAVGVARAGASRPIELSDPFHIGSITKAMTGTLAARMVEAGLIRWDSTPAQLWPSESAQMHASLRRVTLSDLLSHAAGVQPFTSDTEIAKVAIPAGSPRKQRAAFAKLVLKSAPASKAGEFVYSNASVSIAAAMLEQAANRSWEELIRERVWSPLSMSSCGFGWPSATGAETRSHRLTGSTYKETQEAPSGAVPVWLAPAGGVHCSVSDVARFGEAHLLGHLGQREYLRGETFAGFLAASSGYRRGWQNDTFGLLHRGGTTQGWHALLIVAPSSGITVATAINAREPGNTDELMTEAAQLAFDLFAAKPAKK